MVEARLSDWMPVSEAAAALGLTRQRILQLVGDGALRSRVLGRQTLVRREDVEARLESRPAAGRRYSPRRAWTLILLFDGAAPPGLDAPTLSRLRAVARRGLWDIRARLGSRAQRGDLRAHSSDLARLAAEGAAVRTGPRFAAEAGLGLVAPEAPVELYVDVATARRLERRYALRPTDEPNVVLRVVPDEVRAWIAGPVAPRAAVALDLADDRDPRSQQVAREALTAR